MSLKYLLDTDVLSEPLKPKPDPKLMRFLEAREEAIATAAPVWHELMFGYSRLPAGKRKELIGQYLETVVALSIPILAYDPEAARIHAVERARLECLGKIPPFVDGQIAAIAMADDLTLITKNTKDYLGFKKLRIESRHG